MFHIELRAASQRMHRLNLNEGELLESVLEPWVRGEQIEMGDCSWGASAGSILVLEGPEIPVGRLTMGRGWSVAQSEGSDVTQALLDRAREAVAAAAVARAQGAAAGAQGPLAGARGTVAAPGSIAPAHQAAASPAWPTGPASPAQGVGGLMAPADANVLADALGLELLRNLNQTPMSLPSAWKLAAERHPQLPIGVSLELVQRAVASLARSRLITLAHAGGAGARDLDDGDLDTALRTIDSWTAEAGGEAVWLRRS